MSIRPSPRLRDPQRLDVLRSTHLLDSAPEEQFDRLTRLATQMLHATMAAVTLVDDHRQFFKSAVGLPEPFQTDREVPLPYSFCRYVVGSGRRLIVEDARRHRWLRNNPSIAELGIVSYVGIPLRRFGFTLGSFCVMDSRPRQWREEELKLLDVLAAEAQSQLLIEGANPRPSSSGDPSSSESMVVQELLSLTARFHTLVEQAVVGIGVVQDDRVRYANAAFATIFGYRHEELLRLDSLLQLVCEEDRAAVEGEFRRALNGDSRHFEHRFRGVRSSGEIAHVHVYGSRCEVDGTPAVAGVLLDETERVRTEEALRSSEVRLRRVLDLAHEAFVTIDQEGVITEWNLQAERTFGWSREEAIGSRLADTILPSQHREAHEEGVKRFLRTGEGPILDRRVELTARHRDGRTIPVELTVTPVNLGTTYLFASFLHDISDRRRVEEELRRSAERYRGFFEDDLTGDLVATPEGKVLACNRAFSQMFGYDSVEEVLNTDAMQFSASPEDHQRWIQLLLEQGRIEMQELELFRKDGSPIQVVENATGTFDESGQLIEFRRYVFDITERKRMEQALRRSEEQFRSLIENAWDIVHIVDPLGTIRYISPSVERVLGYAPAELIGRVGTDFVHPEDAGRVETMFKEIIATPGAERYFEVRIRHRDGSWRTAEVRSKVLKDTGGLPIAIVHTHDITERTQMLEALRKSEERFQLVAKATSDVLWEWDIATGEIVWSEAAPKVFRYAAADLGDSIEWWVERVHPEDRERVVADLYHTVQGTGVVWSAEYRFLRGDRSYATTLDRGYVVREENEVAIRVIGSMMDVTERRRSEEAQRLLARASSLLESSLDPGVTLPALARAIVPVLADYCTIDLLEEQHLRRAAAAHAIPTQEPLLVAVEPQALGGPENDLSTRVVRDGEPILLPQVSAGPSRNTGTEQSKHLKRLGTRSLMIVPLKMHEEVLGVITLGTAESGRHYTPLDLLVTEDLARRVSLTLENARLYRRQQEAVREREQILGVVSHDLRNPLNTIQISTQLLSDVYKERRSESLQWLQIIQRSGEQMERMIDDLLDLSSIDAGKFTMDRVEHGVVDLMREACELFEPLATQKSLQFRCDTGDLHQKVWIDSHRVLRVFSNLVGNALKFTPTGGTIVLGATLQPEEVCFSVSDTGPGIPDDEAAHVFQRYWQARKGDRRGAGLGLSIARGIVEAHGGRIWVQSTQGEGTTFFFTVPLAAPARV
jgi:PAS domain S-box-containing protein